MLLVLQLIINVKKLYNLGLFCIFMINRNIMERYALKTQSGETINSIKAYSLSEAAELFAKIKKINVEDINKIFIVEIIQPK